MTTKSTTKKTTKKTAICCVNDQIAFLQDAIAELYERESELRNAAIDAAGSISLWQKATIGLGALVGIELIWLFLK